MGMFRQTTLVGVGLIGGSLALDMRAEGLCSRFIGVGRTRANLDAALRRGLIDAAFTNLAEGIRGSDLIVLATPVATLARQLGEIAPLLIEGQLVIDAGSVKAGLVEAGRDLMRAGRFVPCHPIAGTEKGGAEHAVAGLFRGARCLLTPTDDTPPSAIDKAARLWEGVGMLVSRMSAAEHDAVFARMSHLPHVVAYALVAWLQTQPDWERLASFAGGGFRDFTRIAASPAEMWIDIVRLNRDEVLACAEGCGEMLDRMIGLIRREEWDALRGLFETANRVKQQMATGHKA